MSKENIILNKPYSLSPLTLLYRFIGFLPQFSIALYIFSKNNSSSEVLNIILIVVFGLLSLPNILLSYFYYNYTISNDEIIIQSGWWNKNKRHIPISKVQGISYSQNFLSKILRIATVEIETAGDIDIEGKISFVNLKTCNNLIAYFNNDNIVKSNNLENINTDINEQKSTNDGNIIYKITFLNSILYGVLRFRSGVILLIFGLSSLIYQLSFIGVKSSIIDYYNVVIDKFEKFDDIIFIFFITITYVLLGYVLDIILSFNSIYNFELSQLKNKFVTTSGFLVKSKKSIPIKKIQTVTIVTNYFRKKLDYFSLEIQTAGFGGKISGMAEMAVPFDHYENIFNLVNKIIKFPENLSFKNLTSKSIYKLIIFYCLLMLIITPVFYFFFKEQIFVLILPLLLGILTFFRIIKRKYSLDEDNFYFVSGIIAERTSVIPITNIQGVEIKESFLQRLFGLSTLVVDTAASPKFNDIILPDVEKSEVLKFIEMFKERVR